jgi:hypothetical protein
MNESSCVCFFPCFVRTVGFSERTLRSSRLKYACLPCGVHLPVDRVQWPVCAVAMDVQYTYAQYRRGNSMYVSLSAYPHFFTLGFTLCQMINSNAAAIPGRKVLSSLRHKIFPKCPSLAYVLANWQSSQLPISMFLQFRTIDGAHGTSYAGWKSVGGETLHV